MKKIYLTGVILMVGLVSFGQSAPKKASLKQIGERITKAPRIDIESQRTGGGTIWADDFSDPATWVTGFDATACNLEWEIGQNLGCGGSYQIDTIQSTTKFNGYAMVDSDEYGGENGGTETEDSWFTTANPIDLNGTPNAVLEFETNYRRYNSENPYIVIGIGDGAGNVVWPELDPLTDISGMSNVFYAFPDWSTQTNFTGEATDNPELMRVNISSALVGLGSAELADIYIRFHWTGTWGYAWFVDDVRLVPQPIADILMEAAYVSHNGTGEEYGRIPQSQTGQDILVGSTVYNFGSDAADNLSWTADFAGPTAFSASGSLAVLESDSTTEIEDMTNNAMLDPGMYTGTYSVESDADNATGTEFGNNGGMREFMVTANDAYSIDGIGVYSDNDLGSTGTNSFDDAADGLWMFAYYDIVGTMEIEGIELVLNVSTTNGTVAGGTVQVALHDTSEVLNDNTLDPIVTSEALTITQADIDLGYVWVPFEEPYEITDRKIFAGVELFSNSEANHIRILDDETVPQPFYASMIHIPGDQTYSNGNAFGIRLNQAEAVGINEAIGDLANMTISPNPSTGVVNVNLNLDGATSLDINVIGIDGAIVATVSTDRVSGVYNQTLDLSDLANGVYFVKVSTENGLRTEKIMIAK
ncbi:MAG: hypothetical protein ACI9FU_001762 [Granulosicoccus sp.]|jgi:hypothetical protein